MDHNQRNPKQPNPKTNAHLRDDQSDPFGHNATPVNPERHAADSGNPQAADRQPRYSDGFTIIPPNQSRRSQMQTMAQKEEKDLQRWKETHRVTSVHMNPEMLGGNATLAEAREKQLASLRCCSVQKKLKQEDERRRKKQEEDEENERKKAEQRAKSERLEKKREQEQQRRREELQPDYLRRMENFLQSHERRAPGPLASSNATHTSSTSEASEGTQRQIPVKSTAEVQLEHQRVNSSWLDKLEAQARGGEREGVREQGASADFRHLPSTPTGHDAPMAPPKPDAEESCSSWMESADAEPDFDWALMKLMNSFPQYSKVSLEDILDQCDGDYDRAYMLLS
ncbi:epithelial-stromal interaction protein 1 [Channa argus]|uniref:epithelial-stromal interaction protein 1 n=1 Tax=Channa argus TaxID=215402 RepID=UPI00294615D6|nr:hypothetical protein Q8A73_009565 [Channa argus]